VEAWIDFGQGPLFKFCLAVMILGLLRLTVTAIWDIFLALHRAGDRKIPWVELLKKTASWLVPVSHLMKTRPINTAISVLFHVGLIGVPLFLAAHLLLIEQGVGFSWFAMPQPIADLLTLLVIVTGPALLFGRVFDRGARALSRRQDYFWPPLLTIPAITGFLCANAALSAGAYQVLMLIHVFAANLILVLIPFSKIAHCALMPLSQLISGVGWKFPVGAGDKVAEVLGKRGQAI
jgi:nitrate reductase gamma subunit